MTSGTRVHGTSTSISTSAGAGVARSDYGTRSWSGGNSPSAKPTRYRVERENVYVRTRVRAGKEIITVTRKRKLYWVRDKPPKRARGLLPLAYSMSDQYWNDGAFEYSTYPPNGTWQTCTGWNSGFTTNVGFSSTWTSNDDIALLGKLRERVSGSSFNAGVFLAESKPALRMIAGAATRIYHGYKAARKGDYVSATRHLTQGTPREALGRKTASSNWLELQYGWLPLLQDAHEGAEFLAHHLNWPFQFRVRVSRMKALAPKKSNYGSSDFSVSYRRKTIIAYLTEKDVTKLSGLTDPLSIAWELTPYSFVIDWFIPIGNYLSARSLSSSLSGLFVTSDKTFQEWKGIYTDPTATYPRSFRNGNGVPGLKSIQFDRTLSTSLSVPLPSFKPLAKIASWMHTANAVALLSQLRK